MSQQFQNRIRGSNTRINNVNNERDIIPNENLVRVSTLQGLGGTGEFHLISIILIPIFFNQRVLDTSVNPWKKSSNRFLFLMHSISQLYPGLHKYGDYQIWKQNMSSRVFRLGDFLLHIISLRVQMNKNKTILTRNSEDIKLNGKNDTPL